MPFNNQNGNNVENGPFGGVANPAGVIILSSAPPSTAATDLRIGTMGILPSSGVVYQVTNNTGINGTVTWTALGGGTTAIATINSQAPIAGNYVLAGTANQITKTDTAGTTTFSLPAALTAPGSITAAVGNITATNGNFVASTAGSGISVPAAIIAAGASPRTSNARAGSVIFNSVSIAAAADQTLVISNSTITGASTVVLLGMSGATTGSALSIKSVVNSASTCTIVVTNGTGATTSTADIQFDYLVLN